MPKIKRPSSKLKTPSLRRYRALKEILINSWKMSLWLMNSLTLRRQVNKLTKESSSQKSLNSKSMRLVRDIVLSLSEHHYFSSAFWTSPPLTLCINILCNGLLDFSYFQWRIVKHQLSLNKGLPTWIITSPIRFMKMCADRCLKGINFFSLLFLPSK